MKCLLWILYGVGGGLTLGLSVLVLRYFLYPFVWIVDKYWTWCIDTFDNDFVGFVFAITPVLMFIFGIIGLGLCLAGGRIE